MHPWTIVLINRKLGWKMDRGWFNLSIMLAVVILVSASGFAIVGVGLGTSKDSTVQEKHSEGKHPSSSESNVSRTT